MGWLFFTYHTLTMNQIDAFEQKGIPCNVDPDSRDSQELRKLGLIRVQGVIPVSLNNRIKAEARRSNRKADAVVGDYIQMGAQDMQQAEIREEESRLRERFGDNWMDVFQQVR